MKRIQWTTAAILASCLSTVATAQLIEQPRITVGEGLPIGIFSTVPMNIDPEVEYSLQDSRAYDNFTVTTPITIESISWTGAYNGPQNPTVANRGSIQFGIEILPNLDGDIPDHTSPIQTFSGPFVQTGSTDDGTLVAPGGQRDGGDVRSYTAPTTGFGLTPFTLGIPGDFDASGAVGQGDLDLLLLNWGLAPPPEWVFNAPVGTVGQAELDQLLLNWGRQEISYWISVQATQTYPGIETEVVADQFDDPSWMWVRGTGGDGLAYSFDEQAGDLIEPGFRAESGCPTDPCDLAFALNGSLFSSAPVFAGAAVSGVSSVPEPHAATMTILGLASLAFARRRRISRT